MRGTDKSKPKWKRRCGNWWPEECNCDGFDNLRSLIDPKRRAGQGHGRTARPAHSSGRWALLHTVKRSKDRALETTCWMLLRGYGIVFRDVLARETNSPIASKC